MLSAFAPLWQKKNLATKSRRRQEVIKKKWEISDKKCYLAKNFNPMMDAISVVRKNIRQKVAGS